MGNHHEAHAEGATAPAFQDLTSSDSRQDPSFETPHIPHRSSHGASAHPSDTLQPQSDGFMENSPSNIGKKGSFDSASAEARPPISNSSNDAENSERRTEYQSASQSESPFANDRVERSPYIGETTDGNSNGLGDQTPEETHLTLPRSTHEPNEAIGGDYDRPPSNDQDSLFPNGDDEALTSETVEGEPFSFVGQSSPPGNPPNVPQRQEVNGEEYGFEESIVNQPSSTSLVAAGLDETDRGLQFDGESFSSNPFVVIGEEDQTNAASSSIQGSGHSLDRSVPTDAEARFEEGLPLIQSAQHQPEADAPSGPDHQSSLAVHGTSSITEPPDGTPFDVTQGWEVAPDLEVKPRPPQRKSTEKILGSMEFSTVEADNDLGIGNLSIAEAPVETFDGEVHNDSEGGAEDPSIAAMWQAALGDDDLLEQDTNEVSDPASWFPEDAQMASANIPWDISGSEQGPTQHQPNQTQANQISWGAAGAIGTGVIGSPAAASNRFEEPLASPSWNPSHAGSDLSPQPNVSGVGGASSLWSGPIDNRQSSQNYAPWTTQAQRVSQRPGLSKTESFADKSKGGYASPYDLPEDLAKPRKRGNGQHAPPGRYGYAPSSIGAPPPRSTSVSVSQPVPGFHEPSLPTPAETYAPAVPPPSSRYPAAGHPPLARHATMPATVSTRPSANITNFFEDLPVSTGAKRAMPVVRSPPTASGSFTPNTGPSIPYPAHPPHQQPQSVFAGPAQNSTSTPQMQEFAGQLRPPERMDPFDTLDRTSSTAKPALPVSRYSPAPPPHPSAHGRGKYAPIPGGASTNAMQHQPRTSSPLATTSVSMQDQAANTTQQLAHPGYSAQVQQRRDGTTNESRVGGVPRGAILQGSVEQQGVLQRQRPRSQDAYAPPIAAPSRQPILEGANAHQMGGNISSGYLMSSQLPPAAHWSSKQLPSAHDPQPLQHPPLQEAIVGPPPRSQTQSPGTALSGPHHAAPQRAPYVRPASVDVAISSKVTAIHTSETGSVPSQNRPRGFSQPKDYIAPTDGREHDPLCRWRGCPVLAWGFGGTIVTSFPKEVPLYGPGQRYPSLRCSPGAVKTRTLKDTLPLEEHVARFPGPLRGKSKKKDVLAWLASRRGQLGVMINSQRHMVAPTTGQKWDEHTLLLKLLSLLVEHDGSLVGLPKVETAVQEVLRNYQPGATPNVQPRSASMATPQVVGPSQSSIAPATDPAAIETVKRLLLSGEKERAVWHAVDNRMWGHAMLISSAVMPAIWKQVVREFVRNDVRQISQDTESLAAVYQIFAGNNEEFIDELVPSSARAGLQFISKTSDAALAKTGVEGLDKWIETLTLVLSNRSAEDLWALKQMGHLLLFYGRTDAAHICFMFAGPRAPFGGADDPQTAVTLVSHGHLQEPSSSSVVDSILLSEIYEYGLSLASSANTFAAPHLQAYRYYHALLLAQHGHLQEAQQYCESIAQAIRSSSKAPVPSYRLLTPIVEDLLKRLQRSVKDESSSWIPKPSIEKVSDTFFARFNSFVAGGENDQGGSGPVNNNPGAEVGPFARIAGNTPVTSRPSSQNELRPLPLPHLMLPAGGQRTQSSLSHRPARYAPGGAYVPQQSIGHDQSLPSRATNWDSGAAAHSGTHLPLPPHALENHAIYNQNRLANSEPSLAYKPLQAFAPDALHRQDEKPSYGPTGHPADGIPVGRSSLESSGPTERSPLDYSQDQPSSYVGAYAPPTSSYQPPSYEPPAAGQQGYEPPSATFDDTAASNGSASPDAKPARRAAFTDDGDDDITQPAAELSRKEKERKDKEAEESFKKAAEADAKRGQQPGDKKGWFGGWFGKKEQNLGPVPIRAKLGEQSSFYFDKDLNKWVNKKGGAPQTPSAGIPPPPRGGPTPRAVSATTAMAPPRSVSGSTPLPASGSMPPPGPATSVAAPSMGSNSYFPPAGQVPSSGGHVPMRGPSEFVSSDVSGASGPSSQAPTAAADQQGIPPSAPPSLAPPAPPASTGPPGRPATAISQASSIDDLLGPAGTVRKGGTMKKSKKGRGYVDVMASAAAGGGSGGGSGGGGGGSSAGGLPT